MDLQFVKSVDDLRADDNGVWVHGGKPRRKYLVERDITTSEMVDVVPFDGQSTSEQENVFTLVRLYHCHQSTHEFQRRISYIIDANKQLIKYAVVQYLFDDGKEVPVVVLPHGNAKKDRIVVHRKVLFLVSKKFLGSQKLLHQCYLMKLVGF